MTQAISGRADRASGRCPAGESMLGGLNSPAEFVLPIQISGGETPLYPRLENLTQPSIARGY